MAVGRDELGLYALSTRCTHDDCDMLRNGSVGPSGLRCSCHNSNFDRFGHRLTGPAQRDLPHYRVALDPQGTVLVFTNEPVAPSTRVKPVE